MRRNAIVTGGTDGVGKVCARELVKLGYNVIIIGNTEEKGKAVVNEIRYLDTLRISRSTKASTND